VIVNSRSCVNIILSIMIENVGLKAVTHLHPYKVSWINSTTLDVKQQCLVSIDFELYKDKIWYDVVIMDVGQIILERPWLLDKVLLFTIDQTCVNLNTRVRRSS